MGIMKIGCCGFPVSMKKYFESFDVVEVQKTFYKPPSPETAKKWRGMAPETFEFTVKAWQVITHPPSSPTYRKAKLTASDGGFFKPIKEVFEAWEVTRETAKELKSRLILFQTPRSFKDTEENIRNMKEFFSSVERNFNFAFEPRGWKEENIVRVCRDLDLIHVVDPFVSCPLHGDIFYLRLHGFNYKHKYSDEELGKLAEKCRELGMNGYVMFNNIHMFDDAMRFKKIVSKESAKE